METRFIASLQGLTNLYINDAVPVAAHHDALVFGLALIDTLDDEGDVVDFLAIDGFVVVVFPRARKREARIVHLARVFRDVVTQDVVVPSPQG